MLTSSSFQAEWIERMGFKGTVHANMKTMPLFTRPRVIQTRMLLIFFNSSAEKKKQNNDLRHHKSNAHILCCISSIMKRLKFSLLFTEQLFFC